MDRFDFSWEYNFKGYFSRTHEFISEQEIIECIEKDDTGFYYVPGTHYSEFRYFCINYIGKKFIFVVFNHLSDKLFVEHARFATKREIEKYFDFGRDH